MSDDSYWWSGPIGGLGNRLIAIAALKACVEERTIYFPWLNDPSCPGDFHEILDPIPNLHVGSSSSNHGVCLKTHNWEPLSIYRQLRNELDLSLSEPEFCIRFVDTLRHLPFKSELKQRASQWRQSHKNEPMIGVHIRRTDRLAQHREEFRRAIIRRQGISRELPLVMSAVYGIFPPAFVSFYENVVIGAQLKKVFSQNINFGFSIFSDRRQHIEGVKKVTDRCGVATKNHLKPGPLNLKNFAEADQEHRQTSLVEAAIDLLGLASCDAIIQNNRASTFSLVASLIGMKPILSAKTNYPFWQAIENANEKALYGERGPATFISGALQN